MALSIAVLASSVLLSQELVTPGAGQISLPPGPVAEMLERLGETAPRARDAALADLGASWPAWEDRSPEGWGGETAWRRWVELVRAEASAETSAPPRRAALAVLARLQGRDADAWVHLLACEAEPGLVAALLPLFSPGIPRELAGREGALPNGVVLSPALPPSSAPHASLRWLAGTRIERREFTVGAARCSLGVSVDRDGLEVSVRHLSGGPARVRLRPPLPLGIEPGQLFADWEKLPGTGPVEFLLDAEANEHSLWLTFRPPETRWPSPPLDTLRAPAPPREIWLVSPRGDEPHLRRFAEALSELLRVQARACAAGSRPAPGLEPIVLRFDPGAAGERMLVDLLGLAEAFALSVPDR